MATIQDLQRTRMILSILLLINTLVMILLIFFVDDYYYWMTVNFIIYFGLVIALWTITFKIRKLVLQNTVIVPVVPVTVVQSQNVRPMPGGYGPPPPPGFVNNPAPPAYSPPMTAGESDPPPAYNQAGPWSTPQSGAGFSQIPAAGSQPFAAFNQPGQNTYWNPAQNK